MQSGAWKTITFRFEFGMTVHAAYAQCLIDNTAPYSCQMRKSVQILIIS